MLLRGRSSLASMTRSFSLKSIHTRFMVIFLICGFLISTIACFLSLYSEASKSERLETQQVVGEQAAPVAHTSTVEEPTENSTIMIRTSTPTGAPIQGGITVEEFEAARRGRCLITQQGKDGFGHQLRGRLSMMIGAEMEKDLVLYVHTPFTKFEHMRFRDAGMRAEAFMNYSGLFLSFNDYQRLFPGYRMEWRYYQDVGRIARKIRSGQINCNAPNVIYGGDNTWGYIYSTERRQALLDIMERSPLLSAIRERYFSSPKPSLDSRPGRTTVVMHIRRGDATKRFSLSEDYYNRSLVFFEQYFANKDPIYLVIVTDDPKWDYVKRLVQQRGAQDVSVPTDGEDAMIVFHRMVMADGLICSPSSLDQAAVFFRTWSQTPIVATRDIEPEHFAGKNIHFIS
jgi:hypothetical protein